MEDVNWKLVLVAAVLFAAALGGGVYYWFWHTQFRNQLPYPPFVKSVICSIDGPGSSACGR